MHHTALILALVAGLAVGMCIGANDVRVHSREYRVGAAVIAEKQRQAQLVRELQSEFEQAGLCSMDSVECLWQGGK